MSFLNQNTCQSKGFQAEAETIKSARHTIYYLDEMEEYKISFLYQECIMETF